MGIRPDAFWAAIEEAAHETGSTLEETRAMTVVAAAMVVAERSPEETGILVNMVYIATERFPPPAEAAFLRDYTVNILFYGIATQRVTWDAVRLALEDEDLLWCLVEDLYRARAREGVTRVPGDPQYHRGEASR